MKNRFSRILGVAIAAFVFAAGVSAQRDAISAAAGDRYVISAKAGGVNFVSGNVTVERVEGKSGLLLKGDKLEIGDRVSTGADGKAEILLNPGSYLRLGSNSSFEFKTTALDDLQILLVSGSAMFEVFATKDFVVTVSTPNTKYELIDSGVYRVDADGNGRIAVFKGKAEVGDDDILVKKGREAVTTGDQAAVAKFDRDDKDELEAWSKDRAKELAKITGKLNRDNMRTALMRGFLGRSWNMYSSFGVWVFDPFTRSNCFLPFGWGWGSPYGYYFGSNIWYYNLPNVVFLPPANGGNGPIRNVQTRKPGRDISNNTVVRPPFAQVQGSSGATGRDVGTFKPGRGGAVAPLGSDPVRPSGGMGNMGMPSAPVAPPPSAPVRSTSPSKGQSPLN